MRSPLVSSSALSFFSMGPATGDRRQPRPQRCGGQWPRAGLCGDPDDRAVVAAHGPDDSRKRQRHRTRSREGCRARHRSGFRSRCIGRCRSCSRNPTSRRFRPIVIPALVPPLIVAWGLFALSAARLRSGSPGLSPVSCWRRSWRFASRSGRCRRCARPWTTGRPPGCKNTMRISPGLPANAPLWDWTPFLDTRDGTKQQKVLDSIRKLDRRQAQAEAMLDRGDFPVGYLGSFDLDPTPALCTKARGLLGKRVEPLVLSCAKPRPYSEIADQVSGAVTAMSWLVGYGCSCDAELKAWETMAKAYADPSYDVHRLAELRDPRAIGTNLARASGTLLDVERAVAFEGMVEVCR